MLELLEVKRSTLTTLEVSNYLGVSQDLVFKMVRQNEIPHFRIGRRILFRLGSLEQWIDEREKEGIE